MSQELKSAVLVEAPRTMVLGYLTSVGATRVRRVASVGVCIVGAMCVGIAVIGLLGFVRAQRYVLMEWLATGRLPWWISSSSDFIAPLILSMVYGLSGLLLLVLSIRVTRGRPIACWLAFWTLALPGLSVLLAGALMGCLGLLLGGRGGRLEIRWQLLWLLGPPVAVLIFLLMWDLGACLRWIARTPLEEKPAVPFLSKRL